MHKIINSMTIATLALLTFSPAAFSGQRPIIADYTTIQKRITLKDIGGNLSGITYNYDSNTYFLVQNNYGKVFEYNEDFSKLLRVIQLANLEDDDLEDIVYLGNDEFALSSESNFVLILKIQSGETKINAKKSLTGAQYLQLPAPSKDNKGLEALCFNQTNATGHGSFVALQEDSPKQLYYFNRPQDQNDYKANKSNFKVLTPINADKIFKHVLSDLSACYLTSKYRSSESGLPQRLLAISDESSRIMELDLAGNKIAMVDLPKKSQGGIGQYEGITFGPNLEMILVGEPADLIIIPKN